MANTDRPYTMPPDDHYEEDEYPFKHSTPRRWPSTTTPPSAIARSVVLFARLFAGLLMLILWVVVILPIWLAILLRTISSFAIATVTALFTGATPPDTGRLDIVAELWVNGFIRIVKQMAQLPYSGPYVPINPVQAVVEVILAIFLYTGVFSTIWTVMHFGTYYENVRHFLISVYGVH
jgi:hypothetical protein